MKAVLIRAGVELQGGWQTGVFHDGAWRDYATLSVVLEPMYFTDVLPDPEAEWRDRSRVARAGVEVVPSDIVKQDAHILSASKRK